MRRSAPVAIQRPAAPAGVAMRMRKRGFPHEDGMFWRYPANAALPRELRVTARVSRVVSCAPPALHTSVPVTAVTGPGVPLKAVPLITSPSTAKLVAPVVRLTLADPPRADQANVPLLMSATGLATFTAVITPTIVCQLTKRVVARFES